MKVMDDKLKERCNWLKEGQEGFGMEINDRSNGGHQKTSVEQVEEIMVGTSNLLTYEQLPGKSHLLS
jgi:hypothetical protein